MDTTNFKTIAFAHEYPKLYNQTHGVLLALFKTHRSKLHEMLISYDTMYVEGNERKFYHLPDDYLIVLIFMGNFNIPFSTIRRYSDKKFDYYSQLRGKKFIFKREYDKYDNSELNDNKARPESWTKK